MIRPQVKPVREKSESRKAWAKKQPCILIGREIGVTGRLHQCEGPTDPHHVTPVSVGGSDFTTLPLCRKAHDTFHGIGPGSFMLIYHIPDLIELIAEHNARYWKEHPKVREKRPRVKTDRLLLQHGNCGLHPVKGGRAWCPRQRKYLEVA